jgi:bifunctional ADP-heptose synthase (sugar kinase/adenylyltransferase)
LITLSEHGTYAHDGTDTDLLLPAHPRNDRADVSGAGDTVIAVAALAWPQGIPLPHHRRMGQPGRWPGLRAVGVVPVDPAALAPRM